MIVAIIPARGGSKRIPNKNIKPFAGKPIITYSIDAAKESGLFDRIIVSTDSEKIARAATKAGAEVPFMRPKELADDFTPTAPVLLHAVKWLDVHEICPECFCCIYPTAPFISVDYIKNGFDLLRQKKVGEVLSVTTFAFPIIRALKMADDGHMEIYWPEFFVNKSIDETRSNDLPDAYHDAGQFYWFDSKKFMMSPQIYHPDAFPVILPRYLVQDIDTIEDWESAELVFQALFSKR